MSYPPILGIVLLLLAGFQQAHAASKITLVNSNEQCTGFNDPRPASASGGNYGMTLGQQRLNAFQYAANLLAQHLVTNTEIRVDAQMTPLGGSRYSALLGQAGPMSVARDFSGAPFSNTYYPVALAEALYGGELNNDSDIVAEFNVDLDNAEVLGSYGWYYGLDQSGGGNIDYVSVVMHELLHGLGFLSLMGADGKKFNGLNDSYLLKLEGHGYSPSSLSSMSNAQRASVVIENGNLHWTGSQVVANSGSLTGGVDSNDHVFMYAPATYDSGSSVSHFSNLLNPNEGMEPFYAGPNHNPGLAIHLLKDIGWNTTNGSGSANLHLALSDSGNRTLGENNTYTLTVTNNGSSTAVASMVTYMIPHGNAYVSATPSTGSCVYKDRILSCRLGDINHMASVSVDITVTINAVGNQTHAAIVSSATNEASYSDNRVYQTINISGNNDISLAISPTTASFELGDNYQYTASITNRGPSTSTNLLLQVSLPDGINFNGGGTGSCCYQSGNYVECHVPELAKNQSTDIHFFINAGTTGNFSSTVSLSQNQTDNDLSNNNAALNISVQEKDECFIATAAFGSRLEEEVIWLRKFRDRYLLPHGIGKSFVRLYYRLSPPVAEYIRHNELLRALMRGSLGPMVAFSNWLLGSETGDD